MMKAIVTCAIFLLALSGAAARAQTPLSQEQAAKYYQSCMVRSQADQTMKPETKDAHCKCTAGYMLKTITMEDIKASTGNDQPARDAINKIMVEVYAPCMRYPIHDLIGGKCDKDIGKPAVCTCLADKMSAYTSQQAQQLLGGVLAKNPNITDPMGAIMETPEFKQNEQSLALSCAQPIQQ